MGHCHVVLIVYPQLKNGAPSKTPILRGHVQPGESRDKKMRAEGHGSVKTRVTTHTHCSQVTTSKTKNETGLVGVDHQWSKDKRMVGPEQSSPQCPALCF